MRNQLLDLPDELLLEILSYIDLDRGNRVTGHIEDEPPPDPPDLYLLKDFYAHSLTLCSIALSCKRLSRLAQEQLFHTPIIGDCSPVSPGQFENSSLFGFVRALMARPDLRKHVKQLRVSLNSYVQPDEKIWTEARGFVGIDFHGVIELVKELTTSLRSTDSFSDEYGLQNRLIHALIGTLLAILPKLERLCLSEHKMVSKILQPKQRPHDLSGMPTLTLASNAWRSLSGVSRVQGLRYLKVGSLLPDVLSGLDLLPKLHTLDISIKLALPHFKVVGISDQCADAKIRDKLRTVKKLRVDFRVTTLGICWNATARYCILNIIRAFEELDSLDLYAEPSYNKNPYQSVRSFPHYQMNIQNYPDNSTEPGTEAQYWDERVYHARTRITEYQTLVDALLHLYPRLKKLKLPGGFWTLPGGLRKPIPRFDKFVQLETLIVPQASIICIKLDNMRFQHVEGDFDLSPTDVLPPGLQRLRIFDADASLLGSSWLYELLTEQKDHARWPCMRRLEIFFGWTDRDMNETALTKVLQAKFGRLLEEMSFEVILGRDDEVPSLSVL